jgi:hypothetical protein
MLVTNDYVWIAEFNPDMGYEVNCLIDYNKPYYKGWLEVFWNEAAAKERANSFIKDVLLKSDLLRFATEEQSESIQSFLEWNKSFRHFPVLVYKKVIT